jgi:hypothetical protein
MGNSERETLSDHIHYMPGLTLPATLFQRKASAVNTSTIYLSICISVYLPTFLPMALQPLFDLGGFFSFLILYTVRRTLWTGRSARRKAATYTQNKTQTQNKRTHTQTSVPSVGFEPTIPAFERVKTIHGLDRTATVIGHQ